MSTSIAASSQPSPYVPPIGPNPAQTAAVRDQQGQDNAQLADQAARAAQAKSTGVTLDILA